MLFKSRGVAHQTGLANGPLLGWRRVSPRSALLPQSLGILIASRVVGNDARSATIVVGMSCANRLENSGRGAAKPQSGLVRLRMFLSRGVHSLRRLGADELSAGAAEV